MVETVRDGYGQQALDIQQILNWIRGDTIESGCTPTVGADALEVSVASGTARVNGTTVSVTSDTANHDSGGSDPRKDLVYIDSAGNIQIAKGTPAPAAPSGNLRFQTYDPSPPDSVGIDGAVVAEVWIGANKSSQLASNDIRDRRILSDVDLASAVIDSLTDKAGNSIDDFAGSNLSVSSGTLNANAGTGAPTDAEYWVNSADGDLSSEIVVPVDPSIESNLSDGQVLKWVAANSQLEAKDDNTTSATGVIPTPEDYGAAGDGATDDTAEVESFLSSETYGQFAPGSTYLINGEMQPGALSHCYFFGPGKLKADANLTLSNTFLRLAAGANNVTFDGIQWDGNSSNSDDFGPIYGKDVDNIRMINNHVQHFGDWTGGSNQTHIFHFTGLKGGLFTGNFFYRNGGKDISVYGHTDDQVPDRTVMAHNWSIDSGEENLFAGSEAGTGTEWTCIMAYNYCLNTTNQFNIRFAGGNNNGVTNAIIVGNVCKDPGNNFGCINVKADSGDGWAQISHNQLYGDAISIQSTNSTEENIGIHENSILNAGAGEGIKLSGGNRYSIGGNYVPEIISTSDLDNNAVIYGNWVYNGDIDVTTTGNLAIGLNSVSGSVPTAGSGDEISLNI